jgi:hypothetical protein
LQARRVAAELLKTGIADGDGSPRAIKLELHTIVFMNVSPSSRASSWHHERPGGLSRCVAGQLQRACPVIRTMSGNRDSRVGLIWPRPVVKD